MDYFENTVGQDGLKRELDHAYRGAQAAGLPLPHGLLIGAPGTGKTCEFTPGIASMTDSVVVGPFSTAIGMELDHVIGRAFVGVAVAQAGGRRPLVVLEELDAIGRPNTKRLLSLLSEGYFTTLRGDLLDFGTPGEDFFVVGCANDDGSLLDALKSRLSFFRLDNYSTEDLAEIGLNCAYRTREVDLDFGDLTRIAAEVCSPREMIVRVRRLLSLSAIGEKANAEAVTESLRLDEDGLHLDAQRCLVALLALGGRTSMAMLSKRLKTRPSTVQGWVGDLVAKGFMESGHAGGKGGQALTPAGTRKAAALQVLWEQRGIEA